MSYRFVSSKPATSILERPPRGLSEVPDHLRGTFVRRPLSRGERVFDAAIKERVDFVLLCGDLIDPLSAGPRGPGFPAAAVSTAGRQGITTYWSLGRTDQFERWGELGSFGEHVIRFGPQPRAAHRARAPRRSAGHDPGHQQPATKENSHPPIFTRPHGRLHAGRGLWLDRFERGSRSDG